MIDKIEDYKRMAVDAMTGHLTIPDAQYELGKALETSCEELQRANGFENKVTELETVIADMKRQTKEFAQEMEDA